MSYNGHTDAHWQQTAARLAAFVQGESRMPNTHSPDADERQLAEWLKKVRTNARRGKLSADRTDYLNTEVRGWLPDRHAQWQLNVRNLTAFYEQQGRWPRHTGSGYEHKLSVFLSNQREEDRRGMSSLTTARREHLDSVLPEWRGKYIGRGIVLSAR